MGKALLVIKRCPPFTPSFFSLFALRFSKALPSTFYICLSLSAFHHFTQHERTRNSIHTEIMEQFNLHNLWHRLGNILCERHYALNGAEMHFPLWHYSSPWGTRPLPYTPHATSRHNATCLAATDGPRGIHSSLSVHLCITFIIYCHLAVRIYNLSTLSSGRRDAT